MRSLNKNFYLKWSITLFLLFFAFFCFLKDRGYCDQYLYEEHLYQHYNGKSAWNARQGSGSQSGNTKQDWKDAYDYHHLQAVRTYTDAYNRIWWIPDMNLRQIGRDAWIAACSTAGGNTVNARLVIAFAAMLSSYGLHCLDEWDYINDKLNWSQYHFEQCSYYSNLIK